MTALDFINVLLVCFSPFIVAFGIIYTAETIDTACRFITKR